MPPDLLLGKQGWTKTLAGATVELYRTAKVELPPSALQTPLRTGPQRGRRCPQGRPPGCLRAVDPKTDRVWRGAEAAIWYVAGLLLP